MDKTGTAEVIVFRVQDPGSLQFELMKHCSSIILGIWPNTVAKIRCFRLNVYKLQTITAATTSTPTITTAMHHIDLGIYVPHTDLEICNKSPAVHSPERSQVALTDKHHHRLVSTLQLRAKASVGPNMDGGVGRGREKEGRTTTR